jgi:YD repeat-containing protein
MAAAAFMAAVLASPLHPQEKQPDAVQMGLRGPVETLQEARVGYHSRDGQWLPQAKVLLRTIEFDTRGYKTQERSHGGVGSRTVYAYDSAGVLVSWESYSGGRLQSSWEKTFDAEGSRTVEIRYDDRGSISSRVVQRFDTAGEKLQELQYDQDGVVVQRWERRQTPTGAFISFSPRWGEYEASYFDEQGHITEMRRGAGESLQRWTYAYDESGRLAEARVWSDGTPSPELYRFLYDGGSERLAEVTHSAADGVPLSRTRYRYDPGSGELLGRRAEWFDGGGALEHTWVYSYDREGRIARREYQDGRRPFACRWEYRYDSGGRIVMEAFYDSDGRLFTLTETTYDARGRKLSERTSGRGVAAGSRVLYEYDGAGRLLETVRYDLQGNQQSRESSRYNESGELLQTARYNPDGSLSGSTSYVYLYDEGRNWIQRTTLATDNARESYDLPTEILFRTISYYP